MFITQPSGSTRLGDFLRSLLTDERWTNFSAAVAFVKRSGVQYIADRLRTFASRGVVKLLVGVDLGGTSQEGLVDLLECAGSRGEIWVCHNENPSTFHPKVYVVRNDTEAVVVVGSGNLTEGGLFTNCEASMVRILNLARDEDRRFLSQVDAAFEQWLSRDAGISRKLTRDFLQELCQQRYVVEERRSRGDEKDPAESRRGMGKAAALFGRVSVPHPPSGVRAGPRVALPAKKRARTVLVGVAPAGQAIFVMTLQRTDCGVGQVTAGTSRRSPEIFIPLIARDHAPLFWGWPETFREDPRRRGKFDRRAVLMELAGRKIRVNMMTWPAKHDFRLRSEALRRAGSIGDILKIEKPTGDDAPYRVEVVRRGSPEYGDHLRLCSHSTPNSQKRWGYF